MIINNYLFTKSQTSAHKNLNHTMWPCVFENGVCDVRVNERCGEKGCPDSWWYMHKYRKSNLLWWVTRDIEKFIQFEHTVSSSQDHSIILCWRFSRTYRLSPHSAHIEMMVKWSKREWEGERKVITIFRGEETRYFLSQLQRPTNWLIDWNV